MLGREVIKMNKVIMNSPLFLLTASLDYLPKPGSSLLLEDSPLLGYSEGSNVLCIESESLP